MNCVMCGEVMDPVLAPATTHPTCIRFAEPDGEEPFTKMLREQLTEIIKWWGDQNPRNKQEFIGASEIGELCDRRIGYRIAAIPAVNTMNDNWPANVGTAVHSYLQDAVISWSATRQDNTWFTEVTLPIADGAEGHSDLYWSQYRTVIDWKTAGSDVLRKIRKNGPPPSYVIQAHIYGLGFQRLGVDVERVALVFLSRSGWLKDMYVWTAPYDQSVAELALARVFRIAQQIVDLDVLKQSHRWEQIDAYPSDTCGLCPWYDPNRDPDIGADHTGCPGR